MEQKRNYQRELERIIEAVQGRTMDNETEEYPTLFLHACCAPCSSHCLEYLCRYFLITVFFYNPNISADEEYKHRVDEEKRLIATYNEEIAGGFRQGHTIKIIEGNYDPERFYAMSKGLEACPEGGERCFKCYELRLRETAKEAESYGDFEYFTTTLTISPLKNAAKLNEIGEQIAMELKEAGSSLKWLPSDFKKKDGYKRSIELSAKYGLYRQDYCGCAYSKAERERSKCSEEEKRQILTK